ncbi:hypothetical protein BDZ85DRAFT_118033 [Elsinoe ampelina]|uniref:Rhodopsin domain-containing protein n=1 Tax=Elsinoe ampelina TaxID=302913 RepID=A0A6A6GAR9_9PEZI|nr:hypothetical protein BDZ85DRAFT_118033 [Elsinoe ampelina]
MDAENAPFKGSYGGRGPRLVALSWVFFSIGIVVVALRTYTTLFIVKRPRFDLYFTLIAAALAITAQPFMVLAVYKGVGNAVQNVAPADLADLLFWQWCYYIPVIVSTIFSKLAVATLILQIQDRTFRIMRYALYVVMTITIILGLFIPSTIFAQCSPVSDLWLTNPNMNPKCKLVDVVLVGGTVQGSFSAFTDFFLALYPAIIFWRLQMSWRRRIGICILFLGGAVSGIGAILKTVYVLGLKSSTNPTGATADLMTWAHVEVWLLIWMSTLPPLRPLFVKVFKTISTHASSLGSGRKSKNTNSSAGFYELSKGGSAKRTSRHMEIECAGESTKKPRGETWMEPTSSEEDILGEVRRPNTGVGLTEVEAGIRGLGPAGASAGQSQGLEPDGIVQRHVVSQVLPAHVRGYDGIVVDREFTVERSGKRTSPAGGEHWRQALGR